MKYLIELTVNKEKREGLAEHQITLLDFLRDELDLTGAKEGCGSGQCGACSIIMDGLLVNSCLILAVEARGKNITTIEGISGPDKLSPIQQAFAEYGGIQCGFCIPGMVLTAKNLLEMYPKATEEEIRMGIAGNLCSCSGYTKIVEAIASVSRARKL